MRKVSINFIEEFVQLVLTLNSKGLDLIKPEG
jgi:hypothetical protein